MRPKQLFHYDSFESLSEVISVSRLLNKIIEISNISILNPGIRLNAFQSSILSSCASKQSAET